MSLAVSATENLHDGPAPDSAAALLAIMLLTFAGAISQGIAPFIVNGLVTHGGLTTSQSGLCISAEMGGSALGSICVLVLLTRTRVRVLAVAALLLVVAGNLLCLPASTTAQYAGARFIAGIGCGLTTAGFGLIAATRQAARNFAIFSGSAVTLIALVGASVPALLTLHGVDALFVVIPLPAFAALLLAHLLPSSGPAGRAPSVATWMSGQIRSVVSALLTSLFFFVSLAAMWPYLAQIGVARGNAAAHVTLIVSSSFLIGGTLGSLIAALAARRFGSRTMIAVGTVGMAIASGILVEIPGSAAFAGATLGFLLLWFTTYPFLMSLLANVDPSGRVAVLGVLSQSLGWMSGPAIGSALANQQAYSQLGALSAAGFLVATACMASGRVKSLPGRIDMA